VDFHKIRIDCIKFWKNRIEVIGFIGTNIIGLQCSWRETCIAFSLQYINSLGQAFKRREYAFVNGCFKSTSSNQR